MKALRLELRLQRFVKIIDRFREIISFIPPPTCSFIRMLRHTPGDKIAHSIDDSLRIFRNGFKTHFEWKARQVWLPSIDTYDNVRAGRGRWGDLEMQACPKLGEYYHVTQNSTRSGLTRDQSSLWDNYRIPFGLRWILVIHHECSVTVHTPPSVGKYENGSAQVCRETFSTSYDRMGRLFSQIQLYHRQGPREIPRCPWLPWSCCGFFPWLLSWLDQLWTRMCPIDYAASLDSWQCSWMVHSRGTRSPPWPSHAA